MKFDFANRVVIVTGASSGIGASLCEYLLNSNAKVIGIARNQEKLEKLKSRFNSFDYIVKDLAKNIDANANILSDVYKQYGAISGLVLNAGIQETKPIAATDYESTKDIFKLNYFANISLIKGIKKSLVSENGLSVVAISSFTSKLAIPGIANYSASKAALESLIRTCSIEYIKRNVRANSISLGHIKTEMLESAHLGKDYLQKLENIYTNGLIDIENVNAIISFLLSDSSKHINGSNITLDSGVSNKFII